MKPTQVPRPRPSGLAANQAERRSRRNRRLVMAAIVALGLAVIAWDFLRPSGPPANKPVVTPPPAGGR